MITGSWRNWKSTLSARRPTNSKLIIWEKNLLLNCIENIPQGIYTRVDEGEQGGAALLDYAQTSKIKFTNGSTNYAKIAGENVMKDSGQTRTWREISVYTQPD